MNTTVLFVLFLVIISQFDGVLTSHHNLITRQKRNAAGTLNILTNNAQPIHADVKSENGQPCSKNYVGNPPFHIEDGTVFQVTAPKDAIYEGQSLRKSLPLSTRLDLVRAVSRVITLLVLLFSAGVEFYPIFQSFYNIMFELINLNKY